MIGYNIDLASALLYVFWLFFAGLIYYLHRENKREGYPLVGDNPNSRVSIVGFPAPPPSKTYLMASGERIVVAGGRPDLREILATPVSPYLGSPLSRPEIRCLAGVEPGLLGRARRSSRSHARRPDQDRAAARGVRLLHRGPTIRSRSAWCVVGMTARGRNGDRPVGGPAPNRRSRYLEMATDPTGGAARCCCQQLRPARWRQAGEIHVRALQRRPFRDRADDKDADSRSPCSRKTRSWPITAAARSMRRPSAGSRSYERRFRVEPIPGLPGAADPRARRILWQGSPEGRSSRHFGLRLCAGDIYGSPR